MSNFKKLSVILLLVAIVAAGLAGYNSAPGRRESATMLTNVQLSTSAQGLTMAAKMKDFALRQSLKAGDSSPVSVSWVEAPYNQALQLTGAVPRTGPNSTDTTEALVIEVFGNFELPADTPVPRGYVGPANPYIYKALIYILKPVGSTYEVTDSGLFTESGLLAHSLSKLGSVTSEAIS